MNLDLDIDLPRLGDDQVVLPEAEAFPPRATQPPAEPGFLRSSSEAPQESSETAEAPARRRHTERKPLPWDTQRSLRNNDLASWNNNYVTNMADATHIKQQHKAPSLAKKNAAHWVYGSGIGGVGLGLGGSQLPSPLNMFAGDQLMTALTGIEPPTRGRKRSRTGDEAGDSDSEGRRVRARQDDDNQIGRGDEQMGLGGEDDTMGVGMGMQGDDVRFLSVHENPYTPLTIKQGHRSRPPRRPSPRRLQLPNALEHHRLSPRFPRRLHRPRPPQRRRWFSQQRRRFRLQRGPARLRHRTCPGLSRSS